MYLRPYTMVTPTSHRVILLIALGLAETRDSRGPVSSPRCAPAPDSAAAAADAVVGAAAGTVICIRLLNTTVWNSNPTNV